MATEKRLIDANVFVHAYEFVKKHIVSGDSEFLKGYEAGLRGAYNCIHEIDTVDAVEVVRCKDCKFYTHGNQSKHWNEKALACFRKARMTVRPDDYCSFGERKYKK